jgi:1-acyl-sn-glycerol-3-phosphate acyltransferase
MLLVSGDIGGRGEWPLAQSSGWLVAELGLLALLVLAGWLLVFVLRRPFRFEVAFYWTLNYLFCRWWCRLRRVGPCTVPASGPVLIIANHTCGADPMLLVASIPYRVPAFMVAAEYAYPPVLGQVVRAIECIPVQRDGQDTTATRAALRHLKAGKMLGIFIEGQIARPEEVLEAKDGATMLALHSGATVVPAHISGTIWDENLFRSFVRRHNARVRFGEPIDLKTLAGPRPDKEEVGRISALLLERIRELGRAPARGVKEPEAGKVMN